MGFYTKNWVNLRFGATLRRYPGFTRHTPFLRSEKQHRVGKTPTEILTGKPHQHWLEMLGFERFKRAA